MQSTFTHPHPTLNRLTHYGAGLFSAVMLVGVLAQAFIALTDARAPLLLLSAVITLLLIPPVLMLTTIAPTLAISAEGLTIEPVLWASIHLTWADVRELKDYPLLPPPDSEIRRRMLVGKARYRPAEGKMLVIPRLPAQYKINGFFCGEGLTPVIAFTNRTHADYDKLAKKVQIYYQEARVISVIATVLNEGESIRRLMDSLVAQTQRPDEVVIVDGGSRDNTVAILHEYADRLPLRVLVEPGANISAGRNCAIDAAQGDIIAITDAGVTLEHDWLERITAPLVDNADVQVVGGFFHADGRTVFEAAMGATVLPLADEIDAAAFLPSSRSLAVRKASWTAVGGYPEWLDYCEDLIFDLRLKRRVKFAFEADAVVHFRPRGSLRSFFKQYYLYARGDGKADLWRKRHAIRYATYLLAAPVIGLLGAWVHPLLWALFVPGAAVYLYQPYRRLPRVLRSAGYTSPLQTAYAAALVPVIRVVGDVAKMLGYPVGVRWRLQRHPPDWHAE